MLSRIGVPLLLLLLSASMLPAQVVRFETTMGSFDMVLNPTGNPLLEGHVENMLQYVRDNRYKGSWINRADTGFVLQMGGFYSHTKRPPLTIDSTRPVATFDPVPGAVGIPGLSNTVGTVSLALPGDGMGGTNQDAGTSSFFVNLTSNTFLDADFTVFAAIPNMTVVNQIMALTTQDYTADTTEPIFGAQPGNLGFTDVPIQQNGFQVFIVRTFEINDPLAVARARAGVATTMALSAAAASGGSGSSGSPLVSAAPIPEPASLLVAAMGIATLFACCRRRCR